MLSQLKLNVILPGELMSSDKDFFSSRCMSLLDPLFLTKAARVARRQRVPGRVHVYINEGIHQGR